MKPVLDSAQSRQADRYMIDTLGIPGLVLMEQAARGCVQEIRAAYPSLSACCIVCGPGNNGGDGLAIARILTDAGIHVQLVRAFPDIPWIGDAALENEILVNAASPALCRVDFRPDLRCEAPVLIDAVFGTGLDRPLDGDAKAVVNWINNSCREIVAVDIPSGLYAGTGAIPGPHVGAKRTITFQSHKPVHLVSPACLTCGEVTVIDIGISQTAMHSVSPSIFVPEAADILQLMPARSADTHKGRHGHALLAGGSALAPGCMALASQAALAVGAGLVSGLVPGLARTLYFQEGWETMLRGPVTDDAAWLDQRHCNTAFLEGIQAIGAGPGMGTAKDTLDFLKWLLENANTPIVLDADALNLLSLHPEMWSIVPQNTIITPHPGEMSRLQLHPDPVSHRLEAATALAREHMVVVVLKGFHSLIATPDGRVYINTTGNPGMATAGSGDVLTGMLTGLLAMGLSPEHAAISGVFLHGSAGDLAAAALGMQGLRARDILNHIPQAIHSVGRT